MRLLDGWVGCSTADPHVPDSSTRVASCPLPASCRCRRRTRRLISMALMFTGHLTDLADGSTRITVTVWPPTCQPLPPQPYW